MGKKKIAEPSSDPVDYGTAELGRQFRVVPVLARGPNAGFNARVADETEIDRLLLNDLITPHEHSILEDFLRKLLKANIGALRSPSYEAPVQSDPSIIGDKRAQLMRSIVGIITDMDGHKSIGPVRRRAVVNMLLIDTAWPSDNLTGLKDAIFALQNIMSGR